MYELTLLKWDTDIQLELGASIMSLLNTLRDQAVQVNRLIPACLCDGNNISFFTTLPENYNDHCLRIPGHGSSMAIDSGMWNDSKHVFPNSLLFFVLM